MLEDLRNIYIAHPRLRYVAWMGLVCIAIFLLWTAGGFPPPAWRVLIEFIIQMPRLWDIQGAAILLPLLALVALSLLWLLSWAALVWITLSVVRLHRTIPGSRLAASVNYRAEDWLPSPAAIATDGPLMMQTTSFLRLPQRPQQEQSLPSSVHNPRISLIPETPAPAHKISRPDNATTTQVSGDGMNKPMPALHYEVGVGWDVGLARRHEANEDSIVALENIYTHQGQLVPLALFVVADGMGGHACGQEASRVATRSLVHTVMPNIMISNELSDEFLTDVLIGGVEWANRAVYQRAQELGKDIGTTLTAALLVGTKAYIVNVGDSRTYLYREGRGLAQITRDHSLVATLVEFGQISAEEVYTHPDRGKVYRSLGSDEDIEVDSFVLDVQSRDMLVLCSDGLWEMVRDGDIQRVLQRNRNFAINASTGLIQAALLGGGVDNVSVIVVKVP